MTEVIRCPRCDETGREVVVVGKRRVLQTCGGCVGTGRMEVPSAVVVRIGELEEREEREEAE